MFGGITGVSAQYSSFLGFIRGPTYQHLASMRGGIWVR